MPEARSSIASLKTGAAALTPRLVALYDRLHRAPELSGFEYRTAQLIADAMAPLECEIIRAIGGPGLACVLRNGPGPTVLLRAELDALAVGDAEGEDAAPANPVRHACGHDANATALWGTMALLNERRTEWVGTLVAVFQHAEETGTGAAQMVAAGLLQHFPSPTVCLAQHVTAHPVGVVGSRAGTMMAAADTLRVRFFGRGGHASAPGTAVDSIRMAASAVGRISAVTDREWAVVTISSIHAGRAENAIPDHADLTVNIRTITDASRCRVLAAVRAAIVAEAAAAGATRQPRIVRGSTFSLTENGLPETAELLETLAAAGFHTVDLPIPMAASEDFGEFARAAGCPSVYWTWGGTAPGRFSPDELRSLARGVLPPDLAGNHSSRFAPDAKAALPAGVLSLTLAAKHWLGDPSGSP